MSLNVLHLTGELWPYARTGGLGQAVGDLAAFQASTGVPVTICLPLYRVAREVAGDLSRCGEAFHVQTGESLEDVSCWEPKSKSRKGPRVLFLDHPASFDRPGIYGDDGSDYADNDRRFAIFALGALEVAARLSAGSSRLVVHAHDWHAALAPVFMRLLYADRPEFKHVPTVLSVHNGGFQGHFSRETLARIGLPDYLWSLEYMEWYGRLNFLKGGLKYADMVTTVSPTHAEEVKTEVGGFGLQDTFRELGDRLVGIRNGIDHDRWNPETDEDLTANYGFDDLGGKARCKAALQKACHLPVRARVPVYGMSARMVAQKGLDLILPSESLRTADAQFIFLGAGEPRYVAALHQLASEMPDRIAVNTNFTDKLEHRLLGGADFLLMPSLYEPCGLTQMRAQRYGALPVARRVGGLADTIDDDVTGYLFDEYDSAGFDRAMRRTLAVYHDKPLYLAHARAAMQRDFSWKQPVAKYNEVYQRALARR